ncbi:MAG TPA: hypothetical protein VGJ60_07675 [Chloroflexota bacterium]
MSQAGENWLDTEQLTRFMRERGLSHLRVPDLLLPEHLTAYRRLRDSQYFLVRNRDGMTGERYRCSVPELHNCNGLHEYLTYMGVYRPFRGLEGALWGYAQVRGDSTLRHRLLDWAPHLAAGHPLTAQALRPNEPGVDIIAIAIGVLEPISKARAEQLMAEINSRRPPVPVRLQ